MSKLFQLSVVFCFSLFLHYHLFAASHEQTKKDKMKADLEVIRTIFEVEYAPKDWKYLYTGWELDAEIAKAKQAVQNTSPITTKDFQRIVKEFFKSTKDYHVNVFFHSTEQATLPFRVKGVNGRYFFAWVDREKLSPASYPISIGDELVSFDGKPVDEIVKNILFNEARSANEEKDQAEAEIFLTTRLGIRGHKVPRGPMMIAVKPAGRTKVREYQMIWNYVPEKISNDLQTAYQDKPAAARTKYILDKLSQKISMIDPLYDYLGEMGIFASRNDLPGTKESYIPPLGKIWWKSDSHDPFHAYIYENEEKRLVGYVRIPIYKSFDDCYDQNVESFATIIRFFEQRTDALVIDQINNPGGVIPYMYALASMLTEKPLITPKQRRTITQESVADALNMISRFETVGNDEDAQYEIGATFYGLPVTYQLVQFWLEHYHFVISEWNQGRTLTNPHFVINMDRVPPHSEVNYTKPILVLINGQDASCGDFFPAILQDNERAVLLGTPTAGAGGYVVRRSFPNIFGIDLFSLTGSIAERPDRTPLENLGVIPDIHYSITENDLQNNYEDYVKAINEAVNDLF